MECESPRCPKRCPRGTPNLNPTTSRSGTVEQTMLSNTMLGEITSGGSTVASASGTAGCEKTEGIPYSPNERPKDLGISRATAARRFDVDIRPVCIVRSQY